jgi:cytoskeleton protein RodZ
LKEERKLSVGAYLRQERERKNISLDDVAKVTRISLQYLEALERDEFQTLPASVFARGFLRTYAAHIGLDPEEVLDLYEAQTDSLLTPEKTEVAPPPKSLEPLVKYILTLVILALGVGVAFFFFFKETTVPPSSSLPPSPEISLSPTPPSKTPPAEASRSRKKESPKVLEDRKAEKSLEKLPGGASAASEAEKKKEKRQVLRVKATETTWLRIQPDDQPDFDVLLQPQETVTWTARSKFQITVGNAGGVEISFNGESLGFLGVSGQVVHLLLPQEIKPAGEEKRER